MIKLKNMSVIKENKTTKELREYPKPKVISSIPNSLNFKLEFN
jgi:hypothetical protein